LQEIKRLIVMAENYKEQLSNCVENIFKKYITSGLHICDIATGGGKSYTIGKLTCQFYPKHFDRIIILCVQTKLVDAMDSEINKFISKEDSEIKPDAKLVVKNNEEVIS
jgi:superfamily II DNA or RNA helicase